MSDISTSGGNKSWTHARARVARLTQVREPDDAELAAARLDLRLVRAEDAIRRIVEAAPPLSLDQRRRLAALLHPGSPA